MSHCSKCKKPTDRDGQRMCKPCHADYMREWRKTHRLTGESRVRQTARAYARQYLMHGRIKRSGCCVCGDENSEMHHPDHSQPLHVYWLCRTHHLEWHAIERSNPESQFEGWLPDGAQPAERGYFPNSVSLETTAAK